MLLYNYIKLATEEFNQNGYSDKFKAIEDKIIGLGKPLTIYWFARYAKGANVKKLQTVMNKIGSLDECFYFALYVPNASIVKFIQVAIKDKNSFWINKALEYGKSYRKIKERDIYEIKKKIKDQGIELNSCNRYHFNRNEVEQLINEANLEYEKNGYSDKYNEIEREALYMFGDLNQFIYVEHVKSARLKNFEKVALMVGDPLLMYMLARDIKGINKTLMLNGTRLTELDYIEIEKQAKTKENLIDRLQHQLKRASDSYEREQIEKKIAEVENDNIANENKAYASRIDYLIKHS